MDAINVTKAFLPPIEEYVELLQGIWQRGQLTNQGPLVVEFEKKIAHMLGSPYFHAVANGTVALQLALNALGITDGEIITTPFSYVASTSAILWERCDPVFVDINKDTLCIDPKKIEVAITPKTKAILAVHVFGNPCEVDEIEKIAKRHGLKVVYDGAHAFGVTYRGKPLLSFGDIATTSFHATKSFHTIEGGGVVCHNHEINASIDTTKRFGHNGDEHIRLGINAKMSELHAAMGLLNLTYFKTITTDRRRCTELYDALLGDHFERPILDKNVERNYAYYPIIFKTEKALLEKLTILAEQKIFPRRYFFPSLNTLPYLSNKASCPVSEDISTRIACLPLYAGLDDSTIQKVCEILNA